MTPSCSSVAAATAYGLIQDCEYSLRRQLQDVNATEAPTRAPEIGWDGSDNNDDNNNPEDDTGDSASQSHGRTVLTILYLCVLALCFVVPVFYYLRLRCFEESARRELEIDVTNALEQSSTQQREELRASRRKYIEERRARIIQLFGPVRMILKEEHFVKKGRECSPAGCTEPVVPIKRSDETVTVNSEGDALSPYTSSDDDDDSSGRGGGGGNKSISNNCQEQEEKSVDEEEQEVEDMERGIRYISEDDDEEGAGVGDFDRKSKHNDSEDEDKPKNPVLLGEDENILVRLPKPGLQLGTSSLFIDPTKPIDDIQNREMRICQGLCSICLCNYEVGSDVVWSSNEACDHHFHAACIEKWLMKQREGPLCPCCRRDFIVDPFDLLEEENNGTNEVGGPVFQSDPVSLEDESGLSFEPVAAVLEPTESTGIDDNNVNNNTVMVESMDSISETNGSTTPPNNEADQSNIPQEVQVDEGIGDPDIEIHGDANNRGDSGNSYGDR